MVWVCGVDILHPGSTCILVFLYGMDRIHSAFGRSRGITVHTFISDSSTVVLRTADESSGWCDVSWSALDRYDRARWFRCVKSVGSVGRFLKNAGSKQEKTDRHDDDDDDDGAYRCIERSATTDHWDGRCKAITTTTAATGRIGFNAASRSNAREEREKIELVVTEQTVTVGVNG